MPAKLTQEKFIARCKEKHGDKYDFSQSVYTGNHEYVKVICPIHGEFESVASSLMSGRGCKRCAWDSNGVNKRISVEDFIARSCAKHGTKYNYSKVKFVNTTTPVEIICTTCDKSFRMNPEQHMIGQGCRKCGYEKNASKKRVKNPLQNLIDVHGDKYLFPDFTYSNSKDSVNVICTTCDKHFKSSYGTMVKGAGCPVCSAKVGGLKQRSNTEEFIQKAKAVHGDKYDYSLSHYVRSNDKVDIFCNTHQESFSMTPNTHLSGCGCPKCALEYLSEISRKSQEQFLVDARAKHGDFYNYDKSVYKTVNEKLIITCPYHGDFWQKPSQHTHQGTGCPNCGNNGYKTNKAGHIYVLVSDKYTKVGITNKNPKIRCKFIANDSGQDFKIHKFFHFEDGQVPMDIETKVLQTLRQSYESPSEKFSGSTECFLNLDPEVVVNLIVSNLTE